MHHACMRPAYCMHAVVFLSTQQCKGLGNHSQAHTGGAILLHLCCVALQTSNVQKESIEARIHCDRLCICPRLQKARLAFIARKQPWVYWGRNRPPLSRAIWYEQLHPCCMHQSINWCYFLPFRTEVTYITIGHDCCAVHARKPLDKYIFILLRESWCLDQIGVIGKEARRRACPPNGWQWDMTNCVEG